MNAKEFLEMAMVLLPQLVMAGTVLLLILQVAFKRSFTFSWALASLGTAIALGSTFGTKTGKVQALFSVEGSSLFLNKLLLLALLCILVQIKVYWKNSEEQKEELFILMLLSAVGALFVVSSVNWVSFFISLELLTLPLIALVAYDRSRPAALEAGMKFLVIAGVSSAFMAFGLALLYAETGSMLLSQVGPFLSAQGTPPSLMIAGMILVLVGIGFKLSLVPFHMWAPDAYEGASLPVVAFLATISKGAVLGFFLQFFGATFGQLIPSVSTGVMTMAILSMLLGNGLLFFQNNLKRLLAYSSISNAGYMLIAVMVNQAFGKASLLFYLSQYFAATLAVISALYWLLPTSNQVTLEDLRGRGREHPLPTVVLCIGLLSFMGMPLTAGFMGKYLLLLCASQGLYLGLVAALVLGSILGIAGYLKVMVAVLSLRTGESDVKKQCALYGYGCISVLLGIVVIAIGVWPSWLMEVVFQIR